MAVIRVPKPKGTFNPDRPASSLLLSHVEHLQKAELHLPVKYCSTKYTRAIRTEAEAADYIQEVTKAIHRAHEEAAARRLKRGKERSSSSAAPPPSGRERIPRAKRNKAPKKRTHKPR